VITLEDIFSIILEHEIKIELDKLDHSKSLSEQGLDSLDFMTILLGLEEKYGFKISEEAIDQGKLASINDMMSYINNAK
jgi:acyl carrier protein